MSKTKKEKERDREIIRLLKKISKQLEVLGGVVEDKEQEKRRKNQSVDIKVG